MKVLLGCWCAWFLFLMEIQVSVLLLCYHNSVNSFRFAIISARIYIRRKSGLCSLCSQILKENIFQVHHYSAIWSWILVSDNEAKLTYHHCFIITLSVHVLPGLPFSIKTFINLLSFGHSISQVSQLATECVHKPQNQATIIYICLAFVWSRNIYFITFFYRSHQFAILRGVSVLKAEVKLMYHHGIIIRTPHFLMIWA